MLNQISAIGTDTGGSVRLPAAYTGVIGFKPSYGLISRWGVVSYANSLDTVGFLARDMVTIKSIFGMVTGTTDYSHKITDILDALRPDKCV